MDFSRLAQAVQIVIDIIGGAVLTYIAYKRLKPDVKLTETTATKNEAEAEKDKAEAEKAKAEADKARNDMMLGMLDSMGKRLGQMQERIKAVEDENVEHEKSNEKLRVQMVSLQDKLVEECTERQALEFELCKTREALEVTQKELSLTREKLDLTTQKLSETNDQLIDARKVSTVLSGRVEELIALLRGAGLTLPDWAVTHLPEDEKKA